MTDEELLSNVRALRSEGLSPKEIAPQPGRAPRGPSPA
jgi:orotate phosphoribosyltransferase-like protein